MVVIDAALPSRGVGVAERSGGATFCDNIRNVEKNITFSLYSLKTRLASPLYSYVIQRAAPPQTVTHRPSPGRIS